MAEELEQAVQEATIALALFLENPKMVPDPNGAQEMDEDIQRLKDEMWRTQVEIELRRNLRRARDAHLQYVQSETREQKVARLMPLYHDSRAKLDQVISDLQKCTQTLEQQTQDVEAQMQLLNEVVIKTEATRLVLTHVYEESERLGREHATLLQQLEPLFVVSSYKTGSSRCPECRGWLIPNHWNCDRGCRFHWTGTTLHRGVQASCPLH